MSRVLLFVAAGLALAIPVGVKLKSYNPIVYFGLAGTGLDLLTGKAADQLPAE